MLRGKLIPWNSSLSAQPETVSQWQDCNVDMRSRWTEMKSLPLRHESRDCYLRRKPLLRLLPLMLRLMSGFDLHLSPSVWNEHVTWSRHVVLSRAVRGFGRGDDLWIRCRAGARVGADTNSQSTPPDATQLDSRVVSCRAVWIGYKGPSTVRTDLRVA